MELSWSCRRGGRAACSDGVVSYDAPQGDRRGVDVDLTDATYDGLATDGGRRLTGGLGQLCDGQLGQSNFRVDRYGVRGYEWLGWRRRDDQDAADAAAAAATGAEYVQLAFRFDAPRNFSAVRFHANNQRSRDVRVFRAARLTFTGGQGSRTSGHDASARSRSRMFTVLRYYAPPAVGYRDPSVCLSQP